MSGLINTAITGIRLNQTAMSITGNNIVNANTEGYSRQSIIQSTNPSLRTAAGYLGAGVKIDDIYRHTEKYLVDQVVRDISVLSDSDAYLFNISQVNNLLASDQTNLSRYVNDFFGAVNESVNDPGSLLGRQLLLTQANQMTAGFKAVESRLVSQNESVNKQLVAVADNISTLAKQIADLNKVIGESSQSGGRNQPNDLLDKLDVVIRELSKFVNVSTVSRPEGGQDVFIGQGQPLVVGNATQTLKAVPGATDPSRFDLAFVSAQGNQIVNKLMTGGELGALMRFRQEALEPAIGAIGLLATTIAFEVNEQNKLGMDLEGSLGGLIFADVNGAVASKDRVRASLNNVPPNDRILNVTIDSVSELQISDYELKFPGPGKKYSLVRLSDGKVVSDGSLGTSYPQSISVDGFKLNFEAGSFQSGDRFLIQPTKLGAKQLQVQISRAEEFAFASAIRVDSSVSNQGGVRLLSTEVNSIETDLFSKAGELSPPMMVRFTSATTYDVLDYSDPARPVPLSPPLTNLSFTPGARNNIFPGEAGGTSVTSSGLAVAQVQPGSSTNGYPGEVLRFQTIDDTTGFIKEQHLTLLPDETAASAARRISGLNGMQATAYSSVVLTDFQSGGPDPLTLTLNGIELTNPAWVGPGEAAPENIPNPLTPDFIRDRINRMADFQAQGISARSDGINLTVFSTLGVDLSFQLDGSGSLRAGDPSQLINAPAPADPAVNFTIGGKIDIQLTANSQMFSNRNDGVFGPAPVGQPSYRGIQVSMTSGTGVDGAPKAGDSFVISYNTNGTADSRNGSAILGLNSRPTLSNGNLTYHAAYGQLAESLGILTSQARINQSAGESMLRQSMDALQSVSGVNLEEEAARLIQLEQHYNASARLITLARDLFDTLLNM
ncbi:flagellar hook-associated protein FlgK [Gammaproteobacteria bacterium LSUCC0112]|nr:flagellar hook-associated protein FlgK [Gammaproteobacteria bacterium LSUCC0112]